MKRIFILLLVLVLLSGCGENGEVMERVLSIRSRVDKGNCCFQAVITADYGDVLYTFTLDCVYEPAGKLSFSVIAPESIAGITGTVSGSGGTLTFDDAVLAFSLLADGQLSPVSAPWVILKALHSGYLTSCGMEQNLIRATIRDSYADNALITDIWISMENIPVRGEILWENRRIVTVEIKNFVLS